MMTILREGVSTITGRIYSREAIASLDGVAIHLVEEQPSYDDEIEINPLGGHYTTVKVVEDAEGKLEAQIPVQGECRNVSMLAVMDDGKTVSQIESISWVLI